MSDMEYRGFVTVRAPRSLTIEDVQTVLEELEHSDGKLGPVGSGGLDDTMEFTVSADTEDAASAGRTFVDAVSRALRATGFGDAYVVGQELEQVDVEREKAELSS